MFAYSRNLAQELSKNARIKYFLIKDFSSYKDFKVPIFFDIKSGFQFKFAPTQPGRKSAQLRQVPLSTEVPRLYIVTRRFWPIARRTRIVECLHSLHSRPFLFLVSRSGSALIYMYVSLVLNAERVRMREGRGFTREISIGKRGERAAQGCQVSSLAVGEIRAIISLTRQRIVSRRPCLFAGNS